MRKLKPDALALLLLIVADRPYTSRALATLPKVDVRSQVRSLLRKKFILVTSPGGQWERLFPTREGALMAEWQSDGLKRDPATIAVAQPPKEE